MDRRLIFRIAAVLGLAAGFLLAPSAASPVTDRVRDSLGAMHAWVGQGENGRRWKAHLKSDLIAAELAKEGAADPVVLDEVLERYRGKANGLKLPRFVAVRSAVEAWRGTLGTTGLDPLVAMVRSARGDFVPVRPEQVDAAKNRLVERLVQLDRYLTPGGGNGEAWKTYLRWDDLSAQLSAGATPNLAKLSAVVRRYRANHVGLEMPVFAETAKAMQRYVDVLNVQKMGDDVEGYGRQIEILASDLDKYFSNPSAQTAYNIGRRLGFVETVGRSPNVVSSIRRRLSRRNLYLGVGALLLGAGVEQPPVQPQRVSDYILGTSISGTATPYSSIQISTIPCADRAHLRIVLSGVICSQTVGANGPVCIYATGRTPFCASKEIFLTDGSMVSSPAVATANTVSNIHDIVPQRRFGGRLIERIAWKRAGQQQGRAEAIASRHAEQRISAQFDRQFEEQARPQLAESRAKLDKNLRTPLARYGEKLQQVAFSTTRSSLDVALLVAGRSQLGADSPPPAIGAGHDLAVRVHESFPNNLATTFVGGFTLTDTWLRKKAIEIKGELPPELQDEDQDPWSITFDRVQPVTTVFSDGGFTVTIRGRKFTSGERKFGAMNITARYKFETRPEGIVVVRQGDLTILPPRFDPAKDGLSGQQSALIEILVSRLAKLFKPEIPTEGIELPGKMKKLGRLFASELSSNNGWLSIGWRRPVGAAASAAVPSHVSFR